MALQQFVYCFIVGIIVLSEGEKTFYFFFRYFLITEVISGVEEVRDLFRGANVTILNEIFHLDTRKASI